MDSKEIVDKVNEILVQNESKKPVTPSGVIIHPWRDVSAKDVRQAINGTCLEAIVEQLAYVTDLSTPFYNFLNLPD